MKSQPAAPAAPDYAAANQAGVTADINALPLRNAINAATTLGTAYTAPNSGREYDFTGLGTADIANAQLQQQLAAAPQINETLLNLQKQYGGQMAQVARDNLRVTDPNGFQLREDFGASLRDGTNTTEFTYSDYRDWNNPLHPAEAFVAGRMTERRNGTVVRDITTTLTETGQMYVVMPVPASVRAAITPTLQPPAWVSGFAPAQGER